MNCVVVWLKKLVLSLRGMGMEEKIREKEKKAPLRKRHLYLR